MGADRGPPPLLAWNVLRKPLACERRRAAGKKQLFQLPAIHAEVTKASMKYEIPEVPPRAAAGKLGLIVSLVQGRVSKVSPLLVS